MSSSPINIFFSYASSARQDKQLFSALLKHLTILKLQGRIEEWYDSAIVAGSDRHLALDTYLNEADIIVLLFSSDFLASENCRDVEMKRALERYKIGAVRVIYVLLRPVDWKGLFSECPSFLPPGGTPVSIWRNKDLAFQEVVKGIKKVVDELADRVITSFTRIPKRSSWKVPYRPNLFFTGREELLSSIHTYFFSGHVLNAHIQALNGLAGIGKTQIAIKYVYDYQQEYQAVFWVRGSSDEVFYADVVALADLLFGPEKQQGKEFQFLALVRNYLQYHERWLLLLDDLDDFRRIDLLVPSQCKGHVLLTTRTQAKGTTIHSLMVPSMSPAEGTLFLLRRAKIIDEQALHESVSPADKDQALAIVREVDGFPLALDQAGAYIEETGRSLSEYLALYQKRRSQLLQRRGAFFDSHPESVFATLELTFEQVVKVSPAAMEILRLFAFLQPDAIPDEMILRGAALLDEPLRSLAADPLVLDTVIATLLDYSLVQRRADTTTLSIHRIVQIVLRDSPFLNHGQDQSRYWARLVVRLVNAVFPSDDFTSWLLCQRYLPQAQLSALYIAEFHFIEASSAQLLQRLGSYCYQRALYAEADRYLSSALDLYEQMLGLQSLEVAETLAALGLLHAQLGDEQQAERLYTRALILYDQLLGPEHPEIAPLYNNIALLFQDQGRDQEAEDLYKRALGIYYRVYGQEDPEIATTLNNLALLYQKQSNYQLAEEFCQRALAQREAILPAGHPDLAQSWNNLAAIYREQGKYQETEPLLRRSLALFEQTLGPAHPDTAASLSNLASLSSSLEKYQDAEEFALRALAIYERTFGPEHLDLVLILNNLGRYALLQGKDQEAENFYRRALSIYERAHDPNHPDRALLLNNLGKLYLLQGHIQQAAPLIQRAVAISEQVLGPEHLDTLWYRSSLAELYTLQENYQEAEPLYQRILAHYQQALGPRHPDVLRIIEKYALLYERMQRVEEATLLRQATQMIEGE